MNGFEKLCSMSGYEMIFDMFKTVLKMKQETTGYR